MMMSPMASIVTIINLLIILIFFGIGIYSFILFVKLANRGIKALDIYIEEKKKNLP